MFPSPPPARHEKRGNEEGHEHEPARTSRQATKIALEQYHGGRRAFVLLLVSEQYHHPFKSYLNARWMKNNIASIVLARSEKAVAAMMTDIVPRPILCIGIFRSQRRRKPTAISRSTENKIANIVRRSLGRRPSPLYPHPAYPSRGIY